MPTECTHLDQIKIKQTSKHVCEECVKMGDTWVHLRLCLICGQWDAATRRRTSTPPNISTRINIR